MKNEENKGILAKMETSGDSNGTKEHHRGIQTEDRRKMEMSSKPPRTYFHISYTVPRRRKEYCPIEGSIQKQITWNQRMG